MVIFESFLVIFWSFRGHFWSILDHMSVILRHESFSPNLNFALINIWVICWSFLGHLWSLKNSAQIDMSVERGQKGTPDKVSESGNFQHLKNSQVWRNLPTNYLPLQSHTMEGAKNQEPV